MRLINKKLGISLGLPFLILLVSSGLAMWSISVQMKSADERDADNQRLFLLEQLYGHVRTAESDQREKLLLWSAQRPDIARAEKEAYQCFDKFAGGCSEDMRPLSDSLHALVKKRFIILNSTVDLFYKGDTAAFKASFNEGINTMSAISALLHNMEDKLRTSIQKQDSEAGILAFRSHVIIALSLIAAFVVSVISFRRTSRAFSRKIEAEQKLGRSEHFSQTVTDMVPGLIAVYNIHTGKYLFVNNAIQKLLGYEKKEVLERGMELIGSIVHPDDLAQLMQENAKALDRANNDPTWDDSQFVNFEYRMRHRNGQWRWFLTSGLVFKRSADGKAEELINLSFDITESKLYENDLEHSEAKFRTLFEKSRDAVLLLKDMKLVDCNTAAIDMFGASSKHDLLDLSPIELSPEKQPDGKLSAEKIKELTGSTLENGWRRFEWKGKKITGEQFWTEVSITALTIEGSHILHAMVRDITERKNAEERLVKSEDMLQEAQKMANLGSWEWDIAKNEVTWTDELYRMYGYEPGTISVNYETFIEHLHPEDVEMVKSTVENSFVTGTPYTFEHRVVQPGGRVRILLGKGRVVADAEGKVVKMLGSTLDITDIKNTREELKQKDEFIGIASHELKTPLTSIKAYTQLLEESLTANGNETQLAFIRKAGVHIDRLNQLISDLLDVSKIQAGKLQFNITYFNIEELVKESIEGIQYTSASHTIIKQGSADLIVKGDKLRLEQAFINLLTNAIKYSPRASQVIVNVNAESDRVKISVKDFGIGIPNEKQNRIFDRFYRVENTPHKFTGLGIGLYIAKEIIHRHEGQLWVESEPGTGSTFHFTLPLS